MNLGIENRVALVTASSKGIGFGIARALAKEGCKVVICSRKKQELDKACELISNTTGNKQVMAVPGDITIESDIENIVNQCTNHFGTIDILAYNTGSPKVSPFLDLSNEDWNNGVKLLLMSAVWLCKRVIPPMKEKRWGRLIFITSMSLKQPVKNLVLSNVIRLSAAGLSKVFSEELGEFGVTSNVIMQGNILTDRQRAITEDFANRNSLSFDEAEKARIKEIPARRFGTIEEVGNAVAFLASEKSSYINGASLLVDGGIVKSVL
jgi:3-oxoacyl-[acyl-carrier protein] reductase